MSVARVLDRDGRFAGSGFLVAPGYVVTCTHVLLTALGTGFTEQPPDTEVTVAFGERVLTATVAAWTPLTVADSGDSALLWLTPPPELTAARLHPVTVAFEERVRISGYAVRRSGGGVDSVVGVVVDPGDGGRMQLRTMDGDPPVESGFSGSPVWSARTGAVVAMVVSVIRGTRTVKAVPVADLFRHFPGQLGPPDDTETSPYRGLRAFTEEHAAVFKGREALTARLATLLRDHGVLLLMGPSGSGKSSVMRAGVIPALRADGAEVVTARPAPDESPQALLRRLAGPQPSPAAALTARAGDGRILLFVDQLEEEPLPRVRAILLLLGGLARSVPRHPDGTTRLTVAVTLRAGVLEQVMDAETAAVLGDAATEIVAPMSPDELRAAVTAGDVAFEDGLVDTILRDAGREPGRLPLIEFTLDELWQRRRFHTVTAEAYREVGGVSGALANHARQVMARLSGSDHARVRAVLTGMARPAEEGDGFRRRPLELTGLDQASRAVVETLAARRLVVLTSAGDGREYAEPAHQALLETWPELIGWLTEDREFLAWHDQLRTDRQRWERGGRDPGGLLRGAALATARDWAAQRPSQISVPDRAFITTSHARDRRRTRLLRGLLAVVSVLALVAGVLAVVADRRNDRIAADLRLAASRQLAAYSQRLRVTDPSAALQFAQAAWRAGPTSEAYGALFTQFGALNPVDRLWQGLWDGVADRIRTGDTGDVALVTGWMDPVVLTGLRGADVVPVALTGADRDDRFDIDPTGRFVVGAAGDGEVTLWDLTEPTTPKTIEPAGEPDRFGVNSVRFSPDGSRVLVLRFGGVRKEADVRVWDLPTGTAVRTGFRPRYDGTVEVWFGGGPDALIEHRLDAVLVRDLGTGSVRRTYPGDSFTVAENGAVLVSCDDDLENMRIRDIVTGRTRRTMVVDSCLSRPRLQGGMRVLEGSSARLERPSFPTDLIDVRTGRTHRGQLPSVFYNDSANSEPARAVVGGPGGDLLVFSVWNGMLYRNRIPPAMDPETSSINIDWHRTPDGRYWLSADTDGELRIVDPVTGRQVAGRRIDIRDNPDTAMTPDSRHLVVSRPGGVVVLGLPGLTELHRIDLPRSPVKLPDTFGRRHVTLAVTGPDRVAVLFEGILTWWDVTTGTAVAPPLTLSPDKTPTQLEVGQTILGPVRPGYTDQVVVADQSGPLRIWSLTERRAVETVDTDIPPGLTVPAFDATGTRLALRITTPSEIRVWNLATAEQRPIPNSEDAHPLGFTPEGLLVTHTYSPLAGAQLWDVGTGQRVGEATSPAEQLPWTLTGGTLTAPARAGELTIPLDPEAWFDRLCALSSRPFTPDEAARVRTEGGDPDPPCS